MRQPEPSDHQVLRTRRFAAPLRVLRALVDLLLGRVGMPVCLRGRRETLYPRMSRREIRRVADAVCQFAESPAE